MLPRHGSRGFSRPRWVEEGLVQDRAVVSVRKLNQTICFIVKSIPSVLEMIFMEEKEGFLLLQQPFKRLCALRFSLLTLLCVPNRGSVSEELSGPGLFWPGGHRELQGSGGSLGALQQRGPWAARRLCGDTGDACKGAEAQPQ